MALQDLLNLSKTKNKIGISEERVRAIIPQARQYIAFWREYPDLFIDFMLGMSNPQNFKLYFYQRVFLRAAMRHKYLYAVFPRAYSKSFLSIMILMCRCVLYPKCKLFVTSGGKEQAAGIVKEKVQEICNLIPAFNKEIDYRAGKTRFGKDYVCVMFKNGSYFDNIAARETSRGKRRHGGLIEECVGVDGTILSEVIIPKFVGHNSVNYYSKSCEPMIKGCVFIFKYANGEESRTPCQALILLGKVQRLTVMSVTV